MKLLNGCVFLFLLSTVLSAGGKKPEPEPFTFVQMCDPQLGMGGYEHDTLMFRSAIQKINDHAPDLVLICGDLVSKREEAAFTAFNAIRADLTMPNYCVPGNHDLGNEPDAASLKLYRKAMGGGDYFSFVHKGVTFVAANSQLWKSPVPGETEKQDRWLVKTLQKAKKQNTPVIMAFHYPLYIQKPDEEDDYFSLPRAKRQELLGLFKEYGVAAVLTGHTHYTIVNDYEGIALVSGEVTSKNIRDELLGFRLWSIDAAGIITHEPVYIE